MTIDLAYQLRGIRYDYPANKFALELENLEFSAGRIIALVGPNGAGKTTLLLLLGLLQKPTQGELKFFRVDPWQSQELLFEKRKEVVLVTHHPYLFSGTVFDNLVFGLRVREIPEPEWKGRTGEALAMVELNGFEDKPVKELSAGQAQRLALARAIIVKPRVLLLDEPTANIDAGLVSRIESVISEVNARLSTTIIFSTHNFSQAYRLADQVLYFSDGKQVKYSHENYFSGKAETAEKMSWIEPKPGAKIFFPGAHQGHLTCVISPEKIEVFRDDRKNTLSGPNIFSGRIIRLEMAENNLALLRMSGDLNFRINLPIAELEEKGISLSSPVLVRFAPEAVELIK